MAIGRDAGVKKAEGRATAFPEMLGATAVEGKAEAKAAGTAVKNNERNSAFGRRVGSLRASERWSSPVLGVFQSPGSCPMNSVSLSPHANVEPTCSLFSLRD